jgi:hypothetical protein
MIVSDNSGWWNEGIVEQSAGKVATGSYGELKKKISPGRY